MPNKMCVFDKNSISGLKNIFFSLKDSKYKISEQRFQNLPQFFGNQIYLSDGLSE